MTHLRESAAQVAALIPRFSWQVMDEDQRTELIEKVVVPRYNAVTSDGQRLGPSWWATTLGAHRKAIEARVSRFRRSEQVQAAAGQRPSVSAQQHIRSARSAIRKHPELVEEMVKDPEVRAAIEKATAPEPKPSKPAPSMDEKVEKAVNTIVNAKLAQHAGEWEPNPWTAAQMLFLGRWLVGGMFDEPIEPIVVETQADWTAAAEEYANTGGAS
jgi:hypothetical protein